MKLLKQDTSVNLKLGPFLDDVDGKTPETALTINQSDVRLSKNGGNFSQKSEATAVTHDELGWYTVPLGTGDVDTLGSLIVSISASGALPVWDSYTVSSEYNFNHTISGETLGVIVSGHTSSSLSEIVTSGNASSWNQYSDATLAKQNEIASGILNISGNVVLLPSINTIISSGNAAGWYSPTDGTIISGIFDEIVNGTKTYRQATEDIWAYCLGTISASGTAPYKQTYKGMTGSELYTLNVSGTGRSTT